MDKHNNEIYKNWYSTNINGKKKPVANYYYPLSPSRKCMMSVANIGRHAPAFFLSAITCSETVVYVFHRKFSEYMYFSY